MRGLLGREKERGQKPLEIGGIGRSLEKADIGKNLKFRSSTPCSPSVGGGAQSATCLGKEREARTFLKVVEACNCKGPKFPTRGNKTSRSRSTQSSSSKQRKVPDSSRAVHAQWAMETQRKHQRALLARPRPNTALKNAQKLPRFPQNPPKSVPTPSKNP